MSTGVTALVVAVTAKLGDWVEELVRAAHGHQTTRMAVMEVGVMAVDTVQVLAQADLVMVLEAEETAQVVILLV